MILCQRFTVERIIREGIQAAGGNKGSICFLDLMLIPLGSQISDCIVVVMLMLHSASCSDLSCSHRLVVQHKEEEDG